MQLSQSVLKWVRIVFGNACEAGNQRLATKGEQGRVEGFGNLRKGTFGMFRNPTAHEARINWSMSKEDAKVGCFVNSASSGLASMPPRAWWLRNYGS
ncbi:TIGR02391 family protein [Mesorhizobium amorphae]|uniref:TIGR02391 family protein n=1 Tax=Mesorhizobium amorphae TaxID=71433 RepID=UPI0024E0ABEF|nr:TIGR02391 family protein [Mesorhizobium amorphae]